jgi:5-formyltetrahydrofolate cyclo-ligase
MSKEEYRSLFLKKRQEFTKEDVEKCSREISDLFFYSFDISQVKNIHTFLPMTSKKEVNTWYIIDQIRKSYPYIQLSVPVIKQQTLQSVIIHQESIFLQNSYGILEPSDLGNMIHPSVIDLVLVPLLAYDTAGNRIGYGKGYYDEFLKEVMNDCLLVGTSFFAPLEDLITADEWDVSLDYCITPTEVYKF